MTKVCFIISTLGIGGTERVVSQLLVNLSKKQGIYSLDVLLIGSKREVVYEIPSSVKIHKPSFKFSNSKRFIDTVRTILFLRNKIKEIEPDSIISFGEYWNNLVLLSLFGLPYPIFISDRSKPDKDLGTLHNFLRKSLYPLAAGYIAQTQEAKKICQLNKWNDNIRVIGNPIRKISPNNDIEKENIVLSVGRLIKTKHFDQLIKMFVEIGMAGWKLVIVGGDAKRLSLSNELQSLIQKLGAEDNVILEGEQDDIDAYYNRSKIFAFTSSSEGFPNVIGEALSAGLPVVSYNCIAGPSDMIQDGKNGFLIPLYNKKLFKEKLSLLMKDENLRIELSKYSTVKLNKYSANIIANEYFEFINDKT